MRQCLIPFRQQTANEPVDAHLRCRGKVLRTYGSETVRRKYEVELRHGEAVCLDSNDVGRVGNYGVEQFCRNEVVAEPSLGSFKERSEFVKERCFAFDLADRVRNIFPQLVIACYQFHWS